MDESFARLWFSGFGEGLESLDSQSREALLAPCAGRCADSCPVGLYEKAWAGAGGDIGRFFSLLGQAPGIDTKEGEPGKSWHIIYPACGCDLVAGGYAATPALCECSRLSISYCLRRALPYGFTVTKEKTILQGDGCCRFLVELR